MIEGLRTAISPMRLFSQPNDAYAAPGITGVVGEALEDKSQAAREAQMQRALDDAKTRLQLAEGSNDQTRIAMSLRELGAAEFASGATDLAVATLERADQIFSSVQPSTDHAQLLLLLCTAYEAVERYRDALYTHRRFHTLDASMNQRAREEWRRAETAEAQLVKTRNELTFALRRQSELAEINTHLLRVERQKTELLQQAERFSLEDSVTGVHNRRCLDVRLAADVQRARRYDSPLAIAMVDIDNFKAVNDLFAHTSGDEVLRRVAALMRVSLRDSDYVARYGGDEFVLVFPETRLANARQVCEMVRQRVEGEDWSTIGADVQITVSVGVAERLVSTNSADRLLNAADRMLYQAKRTGKNSVAPAAGMDDEVRPRESQRR